MYIKDLKREEECEEQQKLKETELRNEEAKQTMEEDNKKEEYLHQNKKRKTSQTSQTKRIWGKINVDTEESGFDVVKHKHLLMLVHAPTNYEAGDIISINGTWLL